MKLLLYKDRKEDKENATAQKQECGCPSLQPSLRNHTHAFSCQLTRYVERKVVNLKAF